MAEPDGPLLDVQELMRAGRLDDAEVLLNAALLDRPDDAEILRRLALIAWQRGQPARVEALLVRALATEPEDADLHWLRREAARRRGDFETALAAARQVVRLRPDEAMAHYDLASLLGTVGDIAGMRAGAEQAIALSPNLAPAHFMRAGALLLTGDFAAGWREYEWRLLMPGTAGGIPPADWPRWDGNKMPAGQRLLLFADQGRGDVIQFSRYIPWATERCADVVVSCPGEMWPILRQFPSHQGLVEQWYQAGTCAAYAPLASLPMLAGTRGDSIPAPIPYLGAAPARVAQWQARLDSLLPAGPRRVGLVWAGGAEHVNDRDRSMSLAMFRPLGALPDVAFVALQKGPPQVQAGAWFGRAPLLNLGPQLRDFDDTMAVLDCLDLLISVDTSVLHLAGAMGKPAWLLLPFTPDWRWLLFRHDSPWYPTLQLFRQPTPRDWAGAVDQVAAALANVPWPMRHRSAYLRD